MRHEVLIGEFMDAPAVDMLGSKFDVEHRPEFAQQRANLLGAVGGAQALILRSLTQVGREPLEAAPALKVVGRLGVGLDNIDMEACAVTLLLCGACHATAAAAAGFQERHG